MDAMSIFVICSIVLVISMALWHEWRERARRAGMVAVKEGIEYPNNHHVFGVGFYHAASGVWCRRPWNEYREDKGYFWDGKWHPQPDVRTIGASMPKAEEVARVNAEWRRIDILDPGQFWKDVEFGGFGYALRRTRGS